MSKRRTHEKFVEEVYRLTGNEYAILSPYITSKIKINIKHNICEYSYEVAPSDFLKGRRCPSCAGNKRKSTEEFKNEVYSLVNDEYLVISKYSNDKSEIVMQHVKCGNQYSAKPNSFLNGYHRCSKCIKSPIKSYTLVNNRTSPPFEKSLGFTFPDLVEEWSKKNSLNSYQVYSQSCKKAWWECKKCEHEWETRISTRTSKQQKSGCPVCSESKGEKQISNFLSLNKIRYEREYTFEDLKGTNDGLLRFDFAIFDELNNIKMVIEYDGVFHFKKVYSDDDHETIVTHDQIKNNYCKQSHLRLLRIPYWDFNKIEEILNKELQ